MITVCTFTGLDTRTDMGRVVEMAERYPFLEFGVLLSRTSEDKDAAYPSFGEIEKIVSVLAGRAKLALHVCGRAVGEFVSGVPDIDALVAAGIGRVQLNFSLPRSPFSVDELDAAISGCQADVITQHFPSNAELARLIASPNHHVLFDTSGGRGLEAKVYEPPFEGKYTGYAGGMGPDNVGECAGKVIAVSGGTPVWIDMEKRIRTDGYLDLGKCEAVALTVAPMVGKIEAVTA